MIFKDCMDVTFVLGNKLSQALIRVRGQEEESRTSREKCQPVTYRTSLFYGPNNICRIPTVRTPYTFLRISCLIQFQSLVALKKRDLKSKALATKEASEAFSVLVEAARGGPAEEQELIDAVRKNKDVAMQVPNL